MTTRHAVEFVAPFQVRTITEPCPEPQANELLVETVATAVSAGTELLLYRGQMPADMPLDETIDALADTAVQYPLRYGYAATGRVIGVGENVDKVWINRLVFAFYPHMSLFSVDKSAVVPVPAGLTAEEALFLPNMETAVSFVMDGQPVIGEKVAVIGQGVVGVLTTAVLSQFPLADLIAVDFLPERLARARQFGATQAVSPEALTPDFLAANQVDLCFELSGSPAGLDTALALTGAHGRVVIGSWYGQKRHPINLGGKFHRAHQTLISSQVSQLKPQWHGRWDKTRRLQTAWHMIKQTRPSALITHRYPFTQAAAAYDLLDQHPAQVGQIVFINE
ncbi:MAG: zinc-binding alcohol dehydrogenase [Anaerolineales bacterium]|nr:zinc-binding alcohol dehydrogenase [Anaerolineales bacterium]